MGYRNSNEEMIQILHSLPNYELTTAEKERVLYNIKKGIKKHRTLTFMSKRTYLTKISVSLAVCFLFVIGVILYLSETKIDNGSLPSSWQVSEKFDLLDEDGSVVYHEGVRGIEGKIGFLDNSNEEIIAMDSRRLAKMFWYVWGEPEALIGKPLKAVATHKDTGEQFLLNETVLTGGIYSSDAHALTSFQPFPDSGIWKIHIEIDGKSYGDIVVQVKSPYLATDKGTFLISKDDLYAGKEMNVMFEFNGEMADEELIFTAAKVGNESYTKEFSFTIDEQYIDTENNIVTTYVGTLLFEEKGMWSLTGNGGQVTFEVK
jgi:hypothetical protein